MPDPHNLQRFVDAQAPVVERVLAELRDGRKRSHWMWFVFPQLAGLGHSAMAQRYAIASRAEAVAYLAHPLLGPRLEHCCRLLLAVTGRTAYEIMGPPDDLKLHASMTLFAAVAGEASVFAEVLATYFDGRRDPATLARL